MWPRHSLYFWLALKAGGLPSNPWYEMGEVFQHQLLNDLGL